MKQIKISCILLLVSFLLMLTGWASAQEIPERGIFFSTEEDFITGVTPEDGNPIISDGDLLNSRGFVYMRNYDLVSKFEIKDDLGLDAVQFIGKTDIIVEFLNMVKEKGPYFWREKPEALRKYLKEFGIDIWFSTEGTAPWPKEPRFLDGDLLSAASGIIVAANRMLLPNTVPAGIRDRGVDFGLDAVMMARPVPERKLIRSSTEILLRKTRPGFTDGDVLRMGNGVVIYYYDLTKGFEPQTKFLGLDALSYPR